MCSERCFGDLESVGGYIQRLVVPQGALYKNCILIDRPNQPPLAMDIVLPQEVAFSSPYTLYWNKKTPYTISLGEPVSIGDVNATLLLIIRRVTATIFQSIYANRMI